MNLFSEEILLHIHNIFMMLDMLMILDMFMLQGKIKVIILGELWHHTGQVYVPPIWHTKQLLQNVVRGILQKIILLATQGHSLLEAGTTITGQEGLGSP